MIIRRKELRSKGVNLGIAVGVATGIVTNSLIVGVCIGLAVRFKTDGFRPRSLN